MLVVSKARKLINIFAINIEKLYGSESLTFNLHNLTFHLCDDVERHGSSSYHTMFSFESIQGYFVKKIKGNRGVSSQMLKSNLGVFIFL
jgi:hypothetical protein